MKRSLALAASIVFPGLALAGGGELQALKQQNMILQMQADTCITLARTAYVKLRTGADIAEEQRDLDKCIADGRASSKESVAAIKAKLKAGQAPAELTEWRLEWMAAFDATALKDGETEGQYLRKAQEARAKVDRATNKIEIALEP